MGGVPDFGMQKSTFEGIELECRFIAPGLTLQDLVKVFNEAAEAPGNNKLTGDPSKWPEVAGVKAVADVLLKAVYQ